MHMLKHFFKTLYEEKFDAFIASFLTFISLGVDLLISSKVEPLKIVPILISFVYLLYHLMQSYELSRNTYLSVSMPYFVCLGQKHSWFENAARQQEETLLREGVPWSGIQRSFRIYKPDWAFSQERRLSSDNNAQDWMRTYEKIEEHFNRLINRVEKPLTLHFFIVVPESFAFALGAKLGYRATLKLYQYSGVSRKPYFIVFDTSRLSGAEGYSISKAITQRSKFRSIRVNEIGQDLSKSDIIITLKDTGHRLQREGVALIRKTMDCSILEVDIAINYQASSLPSEWLSVASEVFSLIADQAEAGKRVHLFLAVPSSLSFLIGLLIRSNSDIFLYQYDRNSEAYFRAFSLSEL